MEEQDIESEFIQIKYPQSDIPVVQFKCPLKWTTQKIIQYALQEKPSFKMPYNKEPGLFYAGQELEFNVTLKDILSKNQKHDQTPVFLIIVSKDQQQAQRQHEEKLQTISMIYKVLYENLSEEKNPSQITNFSHALPYYPLMNIEMSQEALLMKEFWTKVKSSDLKLLVTQDGNLIIAPNLQQQGQAQQQQAAENNDNDNTTYFILKLIFQLVVFYLIFKPYFQGYYQYIFIAVMVIYFKISLNDRRLQLRQQAEREQRAENQRGQQLRQQEQNANVQQQNPQPQNVQVDENLQPQDEQNINEQNLQEEINNQEGIIEEQNHQNVQPLQNQQSLQQQEQLEKPPQKRSGQENQVYIILVSQIFGATYEFFYCLFISLFPSWYVELYIQHHQETQQQAPQQEQPVRDSQDIQNNVVDDQTQEIDQKENSFQEDFDQSFRMKQQDQISYIEEGVIKDEQVEVEEQKNFQNFSKNEEIDE